jgi:Domain of unknown function (DUF4286)
MSPQGMRRRIRAVTADSGPRAILVVDIEVDPAREDEFNHWYDEEHIPEKRRTEGFYSARRFKHATDPHRYLAVYEVKDAETVTSPAYMTQAMSEWSVSIQAAWRRMDRDVWVEVTQP